MVLLAGSSTNVYASESNTTSMKLIGEGYTKDGGRYVTYENISDKSETISPRIVVSKQVTTHVTYTGHIVPPANLAYDAYDSEYNTQMTGNLTRVSYVQDYDFLMRKETRATYTGAVFGRI